MDLPRRLSIDLASRRRMSLTSLEQKRTNFSPQHLEKHLERHPKSKLTKYGTNHTVRNSPTHQESSSPNLRTGRSTMVGKFTMSVKRIVQEVKEEGVPSTSETREDSIECNHMLRAAKIRLSTSHDTARQALLTLNRRYIASRTTANAWNRYRQLKDMIKDVVKLEYDTKALLDIPKQNKQESLEVFTMRACQSIDKSEIVASKWGKRVKEIEETRRENVDRLYAWTTGVIIEENTNMLHEIYRLIRRYQSVRGLMKELKDDYCDSKFYPFIPRYFMLKHMIRDVVTDQAFLELAHEAHDLAHNTLLTRGVLYSPKGKNPPNNASSTPNTPPIGASISSMVLGAAGRMNSFSQSQPSSPAPNSSGHQ